MKKSLTTLMIVALLATISLALNIDLKVIPAKPEFYDNESVLIDINVTNYELSLAASNAEVVVKVNNENKTISIGTIEPDKTITKTLDLGKFDAGTYRLETYLEHDFLGVKDRTQAQYQNIKVNPSTPIRMKSYSMIISDIRIPKNMVVNKKFEIEFDVNSSTDSGFVEFSIAGEESETEDLEEGMQTISDKYKIRRSGTYVFEVKAYVKEGDEKSLKDYKSKNFVVIDPSKYERIEFKPIEKQRGEIIIEAGKEPERNLIEEVGCFVVGGCKGDLYGPDIRDIEMGKRGNKYSFKLTADDTNNGNSKVTGCYIRANSEDWSLMEPTDGNYNSPVERAEAEVVTDTLIGEKNIEFECVDELENFQYISYVAMFGCRTNEDCAENEVCEKNRCVICDNDACCPEGEIYCPLKEECTLPKKCVGVPRDTPCLSGWPAHEGSEIWINEKNYACDLFEVTRQDLLVKAKEAAECCENGCSGDGCHNYCNLAYKYSDLSTDLSYNKFKKCTALYTIYGLGPAAKFMKDYYSPEIYCSECLKDGSEENCKTSFNCGRYKFTPYSKNAASMKCQGDVGIPRGWLSDTKIEDNSCIFSDLPAHVSMDIIHTGTCVDYSVALTTLLRMLGYKKNEIYSSTGPGHMYNLIKFPGDSKWTFVDTTGNAASPYVPGKLPGSYPYCSLDGSCKNDAGATSCPNLANIYGC